LGFLSGAASALDLGGERYEFRRASPRDRTDAEAIAGDWKAVGDDLRRAIERASR
jgi:hypothetical protein